MKDAQGPKMNPDANIDTNEVTPRGSSTKKNLVTDVEMLEIIRNSLGNDFSSANKAVEGDDGSDLWLLGGADPEMAVKVEQTEDGLAMDIVGRGVVQSLGSIRTFKGRLTEYAGRLYA
jgi:hypothetical protein